MAIMYLWDGGSDTSPYDTKAKAATDIQTVWAAWTSGDVVYMHYTHSQTQASAETLGATGAIQDGDPFVIYSVDADSSDAYTPASAANIAVTGSGVSITISDSICAYGVYWQLDNGTFLVNSGTTSYYFEDCTVRFVNQTSAKTVQSTGPLYFRGGSIINSAAAQDFSLNVTYGNAVYEGVTFTGRAPSTAGFIQGGFTCGRESRAKLIGCDLSGLTNLTNLNNSGTAVDFIGCVYASGDDIAATTDGIQYRAISSASAVAGASTAKNYIAEIQTAAGSVVQDTAIYRTAGWQAATESDTPLSHKMTPSSTMRGAHTPIWTPYMVATISTTGSTTLTVYCVHDYSTAPNKDEAWLELLYLGTSNSVLLSIGGGRSVLSASTWTVGSEAWTGASGKTKMEMSVTATINKAGTYVLRAHLAKYEAGPKSLWIDPLVEVS
jgi:hypothetical protein